MTWQLAVFAGLAAVIVGGFAWYERSRPPARLVALVAALAALAVAGRLALAPIPNVVATTDIALITGYALGAAPGFAVGALAAPVSNIWLGQGPWTAWEMAGWGLVGLAGAALAALAGRGLGRWGLAAACGAAGLAYGALLDLSVMVTYGGEQSLDRYLALSARGIPFNVAHAAGNVAIALAAGPALVRMISRYRTRLEFTWRPATTLPVALAALVLSQAIAPGPAAGGGSAASRSPASTDAAAWLVRAQNDDGGFGATPGYPSSPAMTGWVMLGLEAADRNPRDVRSGGRDPVAYLRSQVKRLRSAGDLERTILALVGADVSPREFAGRDLVARLRRRRSGDGSVQGQVNLTAFYMLAMRAAGARAGDLARPARWLRRAQNDDGGWGFRPGAPSDPDSTGAALQALSTGPRAGPASAAGVGWLRRAQGGDGGYALATSGVVNAQSTAWAAQGLIAAGAGGPTLRRALAHLDRLRAADGHYRYSRSSDQTPVWVTALALVAAEREAFPLAAVPRRERPRSRTIEPERSATPDRARPGRGEVSAGGPAVEERPRGTARDTPGAAEGSAAGGSGKGHARARRRGAGDGPRAGTGGASVLAETQPAATAVTEPSPDEPSSLAPYVAAGLGALAAVLAAGFLWYRRRLP